MKSLNGNINAADYSYKLYNLNGCDTGLTTVHMPDVAQSGPMGHSQEYEHVIPTRTAVPKLTYVA